MFNWTYRYSITLEEYLKLPLIPDKLEEMEEGKRYRHVVGGRAKITSVTFKMDRYWYNQMDAVFRVIAPTYCTSNYTEQADYMLHWVFKVTDNAMEKLGYHFTPPHEYMKMD